MQKWIGVGRINGEPKKAMLGKQEVILVWLSCPRSWAKNSEDMIPLLFIGKRKKEIENSHIEKFNGTFIYVIGEISSRIKLLTKRHVSIGVCVFVTSITFWDTKSIEERPKGKISNEIIFDEEMLESPLEILEEI